ncbi:MAG: Gfo/Idh/MocA family oxidoreductase [Bacteroidales bacterium]|nr:Gfo/Idh/MocA family oxidoreductase [Bacteroidales bacterium]
MKNDDVHKGVRRRDFVRTTAVGGAALTFVPSLSYGRGSSKKEKSKKVAIGFIGVGGRGRSHLHNILKRDDVVIPAICDIDPKAVELAQNMIVKAGRPKAAVYSEGDYAFLKLLERPDVEGVIIATPWNWHTPMSVAAMKAGKYAGVEVSAATTLSECWDLVNTYEETGVPTMILENVCYRRDVMAVLNMVRQHIFGELTHMRCGYRHDLRGVKFNPGVTFGEGARGEARWRTQHSLKRNADLYPTHGVGPVATWLNINRGNRFLYLTSHATKSRGLHRYIVNNPAGGPDHPNAKLKWKLGDVVTSLITTYGGETILVTHDTNSPKPYSLDFSIQGTNGLADFDYNRQRIYIEDKSPKHDQWEAMNDWLTKYDHPLWKKYGDYAAGSGHGGMDFFVDHAFVETVKRKVEPPLDVYDAAAWSSITPLSERSLAEGSTPQYFPDFTRGRWINRKPAFALNDDY